MRNVVAIDPAPRKASTLFNGERFMHLDARSLAARLEREAGRGVLVCWDAPLTGPSDPSVVGSTDSAYTQRVIERFFSRKTTGFRVPKGIAVRPYAGCPHWAISRALLGLPRVGPWDAALDDLPFRLCTSEPPGDLARSFVVEVHPAVALWLWVVETGEPPSWEYKKDAQVFEDITRRLLTRLDIKSIRPKNDDELDALVAYELGCRWLAQDDSVVLLGDARTGALLLPKSTELLNTWARFTARMV